MLAARLDPSGEEGQCPAAVGEEEGESGVAVEDAGEIHACDGDGGFEGEAEGEGEDVAGSRDGAERAGGEAVVRVEECEGGC